MNEWMRMRPMNEQMKFAQHSSAEEIYVWQFLTLFPFVVRVCVFFSFSCSFRYSFLYRRWVRTSSHCICSTVRMVALLFYSFHRRKSTIVSRTNGSPQIELGNVFLVHRAASTFFFRFFFRYFAFRRFVLANLCFHPDRARVRRA